MVFIQPPFSSLSPQVKTSKDKTTYKLNLHNFEEQNFKSFLHSDVPENCVLVVETNGYHGEVLIGVVEYLLSLGYKVDVLLRTKLFLDRALEVGFDDRVRAFAANRQDIYIILSSSKIKHYEYVFFNTLKSAHLSILSKALIKTPKNGFLAIDHNFFADYDRILPKHRIFSLIPNPKYPFFINTHYFGKYAKLQKPSQNIEFLIAGRVQKDLQANLDFFKQLKSNHNINFKITIVGNYDKNIFNIDSLESNINFTGYLNYPELYERASSSHFILTLLDAKNTAHNRYLYDFSGSIGLSYGFNIIPIIHQKFAAHFLLDESNALIYDDNNFFETLQKAISLSSSEIKSKQESLQNLTTKLKQDSIKNLKQAISTPCPKIQYSKVFVIKLFLWHKVITIGKYCKFLALYLFAKIF